MKELPAHDIASGEIDGWRGRCLNLFARGERAIIQTLVYAHARHKNIKIKHLAGQRLTDLHALVRDTTLSEKLQFSLVEAFETWSALDMRRKHFAHGVSVPLLDKQGHWHIRLDFTAYRANKPEACHWTLSRSEAEEFEVALGQAFKSLSQQLGHLRIHLGDPSL